jgi:hypothetical protein
MAVIEYLEAINPILAGFLGGGVAAAAITVIAQGRMARRAAQRDYLNNCIQHVYGPIVRLLRKSDLALKLNHGVQDVYEEEFIKKKYVESAMDRVSATAKSMLDIGNEYVAESRAKLDEVSEIADRNWHLVDVADAAVFDDIRTQLERMRIEYESPDQDEPRKHAKWLLHVKHGAPRFFNPAWLKHLDASYQAKLKRYRSLAGV